MRKPARHHNDAGTNRPARLRILDKEVQIACKPGEEEDLLQAAAYIDKSMRDLRRRNTTSSIEKIAIVTAINTANALLKSRSREAGESSGAPGDLLDGTVDDIPNVAADNQALLDPVKVSSADQSDILQRLTALNSKLDELLEEDVANQTVVAE